jgi:hypothetical protein
MLRELSLPSLDAVSSAFLKKPSVAEVFIDVVAGWSDALGHLHHAASLNFSQFEGWLSSARPDQLLCWLGEVSLACLTWLAPLSRPHWSLAGCCLLGYGWGRQPVELTRLRRLLPIIFNEWLPLAVGAPNVFGSIECPALAGSWFQCGHFALLGEAASHRSVLQRLLDASVPRMFFSPTIPPGPHPLEGKWGAGDLLLIPILFSSVFCNHLRGKSSGDSGGKPVCRVASRPPRAASTGVVLFCVVGFGYFFVKAEERLIAPGSRDVALKPDSPPHRPRYDCRVAPETIWSSFPCSCRSKFPCQDGARRCFPLVHVSSLGERRGAAVVAKRLALLRRKAQVSRFHQGCVLVP